MKTKSLSLALALALTSLAVVAKDQDGPLGTVNLPNGVFRSQLLDALGDLKCRSLEMSPAKSSHILDIKITNWPERKENEDYSMRLDSLSDHPFVATVGMLDTVEAGNVGCQAQLRISLQNGKAREYRSMVFPSGVAVTGEEVLDPSSFHIKFTFKQVYQSMPAQKPIIVEMSLRR